MSPGELAQHLRVLEALDGAGHISQRALGQSVGLNASQVNRIIQALVAEGQVEVDDSARPFAYRLTETGRSYRRRLAHQEDQGVVQRFRGMQARILRRLQTLREAGARRLIFYGAGRVMEVTLPLARGLELEVVGIVDDDPDKEGMIRGGLEVKGPEAVGGMLPADILITTYRHTEEIMEGIDVEGDSEMRVWEL